MCLVEMAEIKSSPTYVLTAEELKEIIKSGKIPEPKLVDNMAHLEKIPLYDGMGFVQIIDMMPRMHDVGGSADECIATAARTSYTSAAKSATDNMNLIRRLLHDHHTSPFEMVVFKFIFKIPIFVARQIVRHRTASLNERSLRYTKATGDYYFPELRMQSSTNKQGSSDASVPAEAQAIWASMKEDVNKIHEKYEQLCKLGISREVARAPLPVNTMTELVWKMDLHNLLKFLGLRRAPDAQKEIRDLADGIYHLIKSRVPWTVQAYEDYNTDLITFNRLEQAQLAGSKPWGKNKTETLNKVGRIHTSSSLD